jgi:hypothetical protein
MHPTAIRGGVSIRRVAVGSDLYSSDSMQACTGRIYYAGKRRPGYAPGFPGSPAPAVAMAVVRVHPYRDAIIRRRIKLTAGVVVFS